MGEQLFDVKTTKKDRGTLEACGKIRDGDKTRWGCVVFNVVDGKAVPLETSGDPRVQDALIEKVGKRIRID